MATMVATPPTHPGRNTPPKRRECSSWAQQQMPLTLIPQLTLPQPKGFSKSSGKRRSSSPRQTRHTDWRPPTAGSFLTYVLKQSTMMKQKNHAEGVTGLRVHHKHYPLLICQQAHSRGQIKVYNLWWNHHYHVFHGTQITPCGIFAFQEDHIPMPSGHQLNQKPL